jgi:hypothetical protein
VKYEAKGKARPKIKRVGYDDRQARIILLAARDADQPHRRWIPWVCAFAGCRLDEVAGRNARDIQRIGSVWILDIPNAKNEGSIRDADSDDVGRAFRLMSATCSDRSRPAVPIDVGRSGGAPAGRM